MLMEKKTGIFNLTNPGSITHNDIMLLYSKLIDNTIKWENLNNSKEYNILTTTRSNCELDSSKLLKYYFVNDINTSLKHLFSFSLNGDLFIFN